MTVEDRYRLVRHSDSVSVLTMDDGENRLTPEVVTRLHSLLDTVETDESIGALVLTGSGKFFCNGFSIEALTSLGDDALQFVADTERLWARLMAAPFTAVTALNGHAFGAGAMLALSGDVRVGRDDRGLWCLPEADLGMPFSPGMVALLEGTLGRPAAARLMTTSPRIGPAEQAVCGVVHRLVPDADLLSTAIEVADGAAHRRGKNLARIKHQLHEEAIRLAGVIE